MEPEAIIHEQANDFVEFIRSLEPEERQVVIFSLISWLQAELLSLLGDK